MTPRLYLDANVFIFAFERQGPQAQFARRIFELIDRKEAAAVVSELIVAELLVRPLRENDIELARLYSELLVSPEGLETRSIDRRVLLEAARQRAIRAKTKLLDAIHLATAKLNACRAFMTSDSKLEPIEGVEIIGLDASTIDRIRALA